ncbi:hypothetical protein MBRA_01625 [Methylobacterium brachiatum]|nr:hypothetical protein MBRA_01625 [Methylobacterium brachiatum]
MVKRIPLAALAALTLAQLIPVPVRAQVGPDADVYIYGRPGPDRLSTTAAVGRHPAAAAG